MSQTRTKFDECSVTEYNRQNADIFQRHMHVPSQLSRPLLQEDRNISRANPSNASIKLENQLLGLETLSNHCNAYERSKQLPEKLDLPVDQGCHLKYFGTRTSKSANSEYINGLRKDKWADRPFLRQTHPNETGMMQSLDRHHYGMMSREMMKEKLAKKQPKRA